MVPEVRTAPGHRYSVFISYRGGVGGHAADKVCDVLTRAGYRTFQDVRDRSGVTGGVEDYLRRKICTARYFLPVLTPQCLDEKPPAQDGSPATNWMRWEIAEAHARDREVIAVYVPEFGGPDDAELPSDLTWLRERHWVPFDRGLGPEAEAQLLRAIPPRPWIVRHLYKILIGTALLLLALLLYRIGSDRGNEPIVLDWLILGQGERGDRWEDFYVKPGSRLRTGDQFRVVIGVAQAAWVYILSQTGEGPVRSLFPNRGIATHNPLSASGLHELPDGSTWFTLKPPTGEEKIYLLASRRQLPSLEAGFAEAPFRKELDRLREVDVDKGVLREVVLSPNARWSDATLANGMRVHGRLESKAGDDHVLVEVRFQHLPP